MSDRKGCINIKTGSFPFEETWEAARGSFAIDTEGCGLYDKNSKGEEIGLLINYCPVCGKKLERRPR